MSAASSQDASARARHHKTRTRGVTFRETAKGRTYFVYDDTQRQHGRTPYVRAGKTEREALKLKAELDSRKSRGERVVVASRRSVLEVAEEWFAAEQGRWRIDYRREMRRCLDREVLPEFGDWKIAAIGPQQVIGYDKKLRARGLSESGAANIQKALRGLLDHAVLCEDIAVNPYRQVSRGKISSCNTRRQHHAWTTEQVEHFIATAHAFDERETAKRSYGDQVETMIRLGLRIAEASGLRFSDIEKKTITVKDEDGEEHEVDRYFLHVRRQFTLRGKVVDYTKTASSRRRVPVRNELVAKLDFRQAFLGLADDDFIFAEVPRGNPPTHSNFRRRAWNPIVQKTGIRLDEGVKITPHSARHATASQLADLDLDSDDVAALLGHSSAKVTEGIYIHAFNKDARDERILAAMEKARNGTR
jgi:integrase